MAHRLKSLRDFFLVLFFINIGLQLSFDNIGPYVRSIVILALFVVLIKPLIVYGVLRTFEYTHKTSIKTSFSLGQISEFSFLLIAMGVSLGHIQNPALLSVVMCMGLLSFVLSGYSITYNEQVFKLAKRLFGMHDRVSKKEEQGFTASSFDALLFGYGRMGGMVSKMLDEHGMAHIIVDHSPSIYEELRKAGKPHIYADATNEEVYREYIEHGIRILISTITDFEDTIEILKDAKRINPQVAVVVVAGDSKKAIQLYEAGADYVIIPSHVSAHHMGMMIQEMQMDFSKFLTDKEAHRRSIEA